MRQNIGQMRMDQADYARDSKKEESMCAYGLCTASQGLKEGPKHYPKVVDKLLASLDEHGCAPWEK